MNNTDLKSKILTAIEFAEGKGYTLITDEWGDEKMKCACALGCVAVANGLNITEDTTDMSRILEVSDDWIISFVDGFDNNGIADGAADPKAWKMGQEIREHTNPMGYITFIDSMEESNE